MLQQRCFVSFEVTEPIIVQSIHTFDQRLICEGLLDLYLVLVRFHLLDWPDSMEYARGIRRNGILPRLRIASGILPRLRIANGILTRLRSARRS